MTRPNYRQIAQLLRYDPHAGSLTWHENCRLNSCKGRKAGWLTNGQRRMITIGDSDYPAHHVMWLLVTGAWPKSPIKFRDGDCTNLRWSNLVPTSKSELRLWGRIQRNNTSGHRGVHFSTVKKKWIARFNIDGRRIALGSFRTKAGAVHARRRAARCYGFRD